MKQLIKQLVPPLFLNLLRFATSIIKRQKGDTGRLSVHGLNWTGNYEEWEQALNDSIGYDSEVILQKCEQALLKVKNGEAVYERDSVLFDQVQYSWPLLACFQKIALSNHGILKVLDFGGSLGSSYYQNRSFLSDVHKLEWHIVEQPHFVASGKKNFEESQLQFHYTVDDVCRSHDINCLFLSGVMQYLEKPYEWIEYFLRLNVNYVLIDRINFIDDTKDRLTVQSVPEIIYKASYPCWLFNEKNFLERFTGNYQLIAEFESYADVATQLEDGKRVYWKGFFLKRK